MLKIIAVNCLQSCRHEASNNVVKYLTEDVPLLLNLNDVEDVKNVLSVVFKSAPADLREFITWVAEVRRQEDRSMMLTEEEKQRLSLKVLYRYLIVFSVQYVIIFILVHSFKECKFMFKSSVDF